MTSTSFNENLRIADSNVVRNAIKNMLSNIIKTNAIQSYHRERTSGDMDPNDFIEELTRKLELEINKFFEKVNNRGNEENQQYMIKEGKITLLELKKMVKNRISKVVTDPNSRNQLYSQWLQKYLKQLKNVRDKREKYSEIGFRSNHYCWYWDPESKEVIYEKGGCHKDNFGWEAYRNFRGRYDLKTKELSFTIPEIGKMKVTGYVNKDVPQELLEKLKTIFPGHKLFYFPFKV